MKPRYQLVILTGKGEIKEEPRFEFFHYRGDAVDRFMDLAKNSSNLLECILTNLNQDGVVTETWRYWK